MNKVVVVGGGVAAKGFLSATLALHKDLDITFIRKYPKGPVPCGIPYALATLESVEQNISPDENFLKAGAKLIIDEVTDIDMEEKKVILKKGEKVPFDKLVLATGAEPFVPPLPGSDLDNVVVIYKDLDYVAHLKEKIDSAQNIVIVGGGFIGVEVADELAKLKNKNISIVELGRNCLFQAFDPEFCFSAEEILKEKGIKIYTNRGVKEIKGTNKAEEVLLTDGSILKADLVLLSVGMRPKVELAQKAGLEVEPRGGIKVDRFMNTSHPDVFAVGDCASKEDFFTGRTANILLASVGAREGRVAAANLFQRYLPLEPAGTVSIFSTAIENTFFGASGMSEEQAQKKGYDIEVIDVEVPDKHPPTLPGTRKIKGRFLFTKDTTTIIGVQLMGGSQVPELVNLFGLAIQEKLTAYKLFSYLYGTHPLGTSSPNHYIGHVAAREMLKTLKKGV